MARYEFTCLSSLDFEDLVRDLLQAEWGVTLEAFKAGRDNGIDLRYSPVHGGQTVIQCKHFVGSGFSKLLSHLAKNERPKIELLRPSRYVVATSVGLSPGNKDEIVQALHPFVTNPADVIGAGDIEGLLAKHANVERANFKLWLTSTSVIERVLHNAEVCQTDFEIERIRRKLPLFVQGDAFPDQWKVVVISGAPGIGKTTLAEMMLYTHLEQGYEPILIQADIAEGKKFFRREARQIFYFDDFLGQFFLGDRGEYFGRNQDLAIVDFMEMLRTSTRSRFILTTREHLLQSARLLSERLARSAIIDNRCILEFRDYTYAQNARILYNHLYFSGLPLAYKEAVLADEFFFRIIRHQHFNPRLIEWLSTSLRQREVAPHDYQNYVSDLLESPRKIWMHAFRNQLSPAARDILLSFYTLGESCDTTDLEPAFRALHCHRAAKYNQAIDPADFRNGLQELDGAFLSYDSGRAFFLNPSVREFVGSVIFEERDTAEDLLTTAIRFKQIVNIRHLSKAAPQSNLASLLSENQSMFLRSLKRVLMGPSVRVKQKSRDGTRNIYVDMREASRIEFLLSMAESARSIEFLALAAQIVNGKIDVLDFEDITDLLRKISAQSWVLAHGGMELYSRLLGGILEQSHFAYADGWLDLMALRDEALTWTTESQKAFESAFGSYCAEGVKEEVTACSTIDEMSHLANSLEILGKKTGKSFIHYTTVLGESIEELEKEETQTRGGSAAFSDVRPSSVQLVSDDDIRQMFETLKQS